MIIVECEQGSDEWLQARAGVITASMFSTARKKVNCLDDRQKLYVSAILAGHTEKTSMEIAGYKAKPKAEGIERAIAGFPVGEYSDAAKDYAFRLAVERISERPLDDGFETWSMKRGHELEEIARMEHEVQTGLFVEQTGFILTDDRLFGASADGLIDGDGGTEYKCFVAPAKLRSIIIDGDWSDLQEQVQGCLWISGRKWWDMCLYCPAFESIGKQLIRKRVVRDENFIEIMELELLEFEKMVSENERILRMKEAA